MRGLWLADRLAEGDRMAFGDFEVVTK